MPRGAPLPARNATSRPTAGRRDVIRSATAGTRGRIGSRPRARRKASELWTNDRAGVSRLADAGAVRRSGQGTRLTARRPSPSLAGGGEATSRRARARRVIPPGAPGRPGGDLLSRALGRSTIGAAGFHGRVRDGVGCGTRAMAAGPGGRPRGVARGARRVRQPRRCVLGAVVVVVSCRRPSWAARGPGAAAAGAGERYRAIRTGRLRASPRLHPRPIDVVVSHGPRARPGLAVGFPLRCLQRLSRPGLATRLRGWRHDRSTRGPSAPVLSY